MYFCHSSCLSSYYVLKGKIITRFIFPYKLFFFLVDYHTPLQESQIITAMCLHMKSHFLLSLSRVPPGVVHVVGVF